MELRGKNIPEDQAQTVNRFRSQAFAVQERFDLAEQTACILESMLDQDAGLDEAVNNTYEANAFYRLRYQLFRLLIVDVCAAVLDSDSRTASARSILKAIRKDGTVIASLKSYYADPSCIEVTVEGEGLDDEFIEREKAHTRDRIVRQSAEALDFQWSRIDDGSAILLGDSAKRMLWARNKAIAHFEKNESGLVALHDAPPYGAGKLTWKEPIQFLNDVKPYVYDIYSLITSTSWHSDFGRASAFYAKAFWDRFKNGATNLKP